MPRTLPVIATEAPGNYQTAALWNAQVAATMQWLLGSGSNGLPMFYGYQATSQSMPSNVWTAVTIDTEVIDTDGGHSTVTNTSRYTCQVAGSYLVSGCTSFASNATDYRGAGIYKNGVQVVGGANTQIGNAATRTTIVVQSPIIVPLAVGDYIEMFGNQVSGGALSTQADAAAGKNCSLLAIWIHT
jgi:hypothetical protein